VSTRERVLVALEDAGEAGVSGEALARELGVSRVAVAKHVTALREQGYGIEAAPGVGYRLTHTPDVALPFEVARLLRDPLWCRFAGGVETASTNADARELALAGAPEGTVVVAARQTGGRGRLGRTWESPEGGGYVSVVLRPGTAPAETGPLALVVGLGIARGLRTLGVEVELKWPNDVLLDGRKLAGILLEMVAESDRVEWVVAGVGLNARRAPGSPGEAAYVSDVADLRVAAVAASALDGIASAYREWRTRGFASLAGEYAERLALLGERVTVRDATGEVRASGVVEGIDADGRLLLRGEGGVVAVASGEVTLREPTA